MRYDTYLNNYSLKYLIKFSLINIDLLVLIISVGIEAAYE